MHMWNSLESTLGLDLIQRDMQTLAKQPDIVVIEKQQKKAVVIE